MSRLFGELEVGEVGLDSLHNVVGEHVKASVRQVEPVLAEPLVPHLSRGAGEPGLVDQVQPVLENDSAG